MKFQNWEKDTVLKYTHIKTLGEIKKPKEEVFKLCERCFCKLSNKKNKKYCGPCSADIREENSRKSSKTYYDIYKK